MTIGFSSFPGLWACQDNSEACFILTSGQYRNASTSSHVNCFEYRTSNDIGTMSMLKSQSACTKRSFFRWKQTHKGFSFQLPGSFWPTFVLERTDFGAQFCYTGLVLLKICLANSLGLGGIMKVLTVFQISFWLTIHNLFLSQVVDRAFAASKSVAAAISCAWLKLWRACLTLGILAQNHLWLHL